MTAGRKILIVDDDAALRHSLAEQLQLHEEFIAAEAAGAALPDWPTAVRRWIAAFDRLAA